MSAAPLTAAPPSPYRGLLPFGDSELDALLFFGRERERDVIVANLIASRLTVLYGPSGVGKSSVLRAGVARHLRSLAAASAASGEAPGLAAVVFASWTDDPVARLAGAVLDEVEAVSGLRTPVAPGASLADVLAASSDVIGGELYVICDQVEEHFVYAARNGGPERFVAELAAAVNRRDVRAHVLLSIREDELAKLDAFKAALPNVLGNYLRLDRLDRRAAREAIEGPLRERNRLVGPAAEVTIEPALVDAVLDEVSVALLGTEAGRANGSTNGAGARIEAPYLQLVMQRLWEAEEEAGSRVLRRETLASLGGAEHIVGDHLERALADLSPDEKDAAASMFTYLVTPSGSKIAHAPGDLADYAGLAAPEAEGVLRSLAEQRIVRPVEVPGGDGARYEIFHDVLGDTVLAWRSAYVAERRLAEERAAARRKQRQLFAIAAAALIGLAIVGSIAVYALGQRGEARDRARVAKARELTVSSQSLLDSTPELSMLLAVEAAKREPTAAVERALRAALVRSHGQAVVGLGAPVVAAAFQQGRVVAVTADGRLLRPDGSTLRVGRRVRIATFAPAGSLVATAAGSTVRLLDVRSGRVRRTVELDEPAVRLALDDRSLAVADPTGVTVVRVRGGAQLRFAVPSRPTALAVRGDTVAAASGHVVRVFDLARRARPPTEFDTEVTVLAAAITQDGSSIATASADGGVRTWSATEGDLTNVVAARPSRGSAIAFTPDDQRIVGGFTDGTAGVWRATGIRELGVFVGHRRHITTIALSADGRRAATASADGTARVWDAAGDPALTLHERLRRVPVAVTWRDGAPAAVYPDGDDPRVAEGVQIAGADVELPNGVVLRDHADDVTSVRLSADRHRAVTADRSGNVIVWDAERGSRVRQLAQQHLVSDASFSPDGRWLVTAAPTTAYLWDVADDAVAPDPVALLVGHTGRVESAIFSPDGRTIATASRDRTIRTYVCEVCGRLPALVELAERRLAMTGRTLSAAERAEYVDG